MYDIFLKMISLINENKDKFKYLYEPFGKENYLLFTMHRQENVDYKNNLYNIISAIKESGENIIFPIHPRTKNKLKEFGLLDDIEKLPNFKLLGPLGYLETIFLEENSKKIVTDSGGIQREAYFVNKPCISMLTLNNGVTSWQDLVEYKYSLLVGSDKEKLKDAIKNFELTRFKNNIFGDGNAAAKVVQHLLARL